MAQEEHNQKCSNTISAGAGRSSKRLKQQKVPQRGLGVAQLEKIRLEEQQKKDATAGAILSPNSIISPSNSSCLAVQCPPFRHNPSPSSTPLPRPPQPTDLSSPNSIFRPARSIPSIDALHPNSIPLSKPLNMGGGEIGWQAVSGSGYCHWPKMWNCEYNFEGENHRLDHNGFAFQSTMNLPFESWPPPNVMHRILQFQQPSSSSSSSSMTELPSNQSYFGNNYTPMWQEEEKMAGMKRSCPFSLDNPPGPSAYCKYPPTYVPPINRSDETASCSNRSGTANIETGKPVFREGPSSSTSMPKPNSKKVTKEQGSLNGDFLTLAPPATTLPHPSSKHMHPAAYGVPRSCELSDSLPHQGSMENPIQRQGPKGLIQQQPFYSFFPSPNTQTGQPATTRTNCNGEGEESVDLNLKL